VSEKASLLATPRDVADEEAVVLQAEATELPAVNRARRDEDEIVVGTWPFPKC